ncbi:hypothetical protein GOP47_0005092 [Adiantum capillus-veneris]|uniref:Uncharacterized protein n=1 Tax=Adiantum capillus-veneris TaxID=13818 RepID=A0A9D4ZL26_ADICA|nr:hypothetical protein GOP47_0005092 [Adiantum capillus-veneris]
MMSTFMQKRGLKTLFAYFGPGFLVAIAYIDPGNFESDLQSGAKFKYELLWIILLASCAALLIQSLAATLGVVTGKHLAEHCRIEYPRKVNFCLWIAAEIAIVASDIPEVLGTAFALNLLLHIPVWVGVLLTGLSTLVLLALQQYGVRKLEMLIALLVFTMAACFFAELGYARPSSKEILKGMFVPRLGGDGATGLAISLLGAMVMPHNLFLHSALVLSRKIPRTVRGIKDACQFYFMESAFALLIAFLINVSVVSVSGAVCANPALSTQNREKCDQLDLNQASFLLQNVLGSWSSKLFGIALLASGQSSTITGTYAGQYVMQGFLNLRFDPWVRNLLTRSVAIAPSLVAALIGGSSGAGNLIIISSMILSFELPFALIPLLKFTSSKTKMGPYKNPFMITLVTWGIGCGIMIINLYYLTTALYKCLLSKNGLTKVEEVILGVMGFGAMAVYLIAIGYLALRTEKEETFLLEGQEASYDRDKEGRGETHQLEIHGPFGLLPREDLLNMQLPLDSTKESL